MPNLRAVLSFLSGVLLGLLAAAVVYPPTSTQRTPSTLPQITTPAAPVCLPWPRTRNCSESYLAARQPFRFYGQEQYDKILYHTYFEGKCNGVFVEVGANDGERFSQSLFFEEQLNWRGLCVEPQPNKFSALTVRRPHCHNVNAGVSNGSSGIMTFLQVLCVRSTVALTSSVDPWLF